MDRTWSSKLRCLALASLLAGSLIVSTEAARANPTTDACPGGYEYISLTDVLAEGPRPVAIATDEEGNDDGYVCRRALGKGVFQHEITPPHFEEGPRLHIP